MKNQNLLNDKTNSEIGTLIFNRLAGKYWYAWKAGQLESGSYVELAKRYDVETAVEEFMDDCDSFLEDSEVCW